MVPIRTKPGAGPRTADSHWILEYVSTGVVSLAASLLWLVAFYQPIVEASQSVHLLSTTVIVGLFLTVWAILWLCLEAVWDWKAGNLSTS
jgi:hypothetical protein